MPIKMLMQAKPPAAKPVDPKFAAGLARVKLRTQGIPPTTNPDFLFRGTEPSLWSFPKHGCTASFLDSYLTCREQTRLAFVQGWGSRHVPLAFEFGTCSHWILEQCYTLLKSSPEKATPLFLGESVPNVVKAYHTLWMKQQMAPTQKQVAQQEHAYGMAEAVLPNYFQKWDGDFNGGKYTYPNNTTAPVKWVSLEEVFEVPYTYPDGYKTVLRGRRDGVFQDNKGDVWVFDTKNRSIIVDEDILDTLAFDLQQMLYLEVTDRQMQTGELGKDLIGRHPAGVIMNVIRRPGQRPSAYNTLADLLQRVRTEVSNPKKFDYYFIRYQLSITNKELKDWVAGTLDPIMQDVRAWWEGKAPHYASHRNLITKYGRCGLFLPITKNDFSMCYRRKTAFSELE